MIGIDIEEICRFEEMQNFDIFIAKYFSKGEIEYANGKGSKKIETFAGLYCAKEAVAKAMGTGFAGCSPKNIEIFHTDMCSPYAICGGIKFEISISHTDKYAAAVALKNS